MTSKEQPCIKARSLRKAGMVRDWSSSVSVKTSECQQGDISQNWCLFSNTTKPLQHSRIHAVTTPYPAAGLDVLEVRDSGFADRRAWAVHKDSSKDPVLGLAVAVAGYEDAVAEDRRDTAVVLRYTESERYDMGNNRGDTGPV